MSQLLQLDMPRRCGQGETPGLPRRRFRRQARHAIPQAVTLGAMYRLPGGTLAKAGGGQWAALSP